MTDNPLARAVLRVARSLNKTESELWASVAGPRELVRLIAFDAVEPPDRLGWEQAAMVAYCAGNSQYFKKPLKLEELRKLYTREDPQSGVRPAGDVISILKGLHPEQQ